MRVSNALVSLAALAVLVATLAWFGVLGGAGAPVGPGVYSRSAIGHAGILKILQMRGVRAEPSQGASLAKIRHGGLLVLAEPDQLTDPAELRLLLSAPRVLLVLPKWTGIADSDVPGWIAAASRLPAMAPISILQDAFPRNFGARGLRNVEFPLVWPHNALGPTPSFDTPVQLVTGPSFDSIVEGPAGILVGERQRPGNIVYILSDPDVISNHGLAHGNAAFAMALIDRARAGGPVIFDETIHGFRTVPRNKLLAIFSRPFAAATFAALVSVGLLAWSDGKRFGAPLPRPGGMPAGQLVLISTIAGLLDSLGHQKSVLARYVRGTIADVAATLQRTRSERPISPSAARLAEAEQRRAVSIRSADLLQEAAAIENARRPARHAFASLATRAYAWKQEMLHGSARHPRDV
jgi:hypothetical protein